MNDGSIVPGPIRSAGGIAPDPDRPDGRPPGHPPVVASIAGSDPSGGAGIQADLKTISALGGYGCAVITALTAQSTQGVDAVHPVLPDFVVRQWDTLVADVALDAVKVGMLGTAETVTAVASMLAGAPPPVLVVDPVMVSASGQRLLDDDAVAAITERLLPLADLTTPNLSEAADLLGVHLARNRQEMAEQAAGLHRLGCRGVLLKGGHLQGAADSPDLLSLLGDIPGRADLPGAVPRPEQTWLHAARVATSNTHGTGCTLSSALATLRPGRPDWPAAARAAKDYLTAALSHANELVIGAGRGPVHHFHAIGRGAPGAGVGGQMSA